MKYSVYIFLLSIFVIAGCVNSQSQNNEDRIIYEANEISEVLKTRDTNKISEVCTEKGFKSLLEWTDSLRNEIVMEGVINTLSSKRIQYSKPSETSYRIFIPKEVMNDGNSTGNILLVKKNGKAKIDAYEGGITIY